MSENDAEKCVPPHWTDSDSVPTFLTHSKVDVFGGDFPTACDQDCRTGQGHKAHYSAGWHELGDMDGCVRGERWCVEVSMQQ